MKGVYAIVNRVSGRRYIGRSVRSIEARWQEHRNDLNRGAHHCQALQRAWLKHGASAFDFVVLEALAEVAAIDVAERAHIKATPLALRYNSDYDAGRSPGFAGKAHTSATRLKMSLAHAGQHRDMSAAWKRSAELRTGKHLTEEHRLKCSSSLSGKTKSIETCERMRKPKSAAHAAAISLGRRVRFALIRINAQPHAA